MGAWGTGHFENDDAADWVYELEDTTDASALIDALQAVNTTEYIEAPDAAIALAAAQVVASLNSNEDLGLPENVRKWVGSSAIEPSSSLLEAARTAIANVAMSSELAELWEESGSAEEWRAGVIELQQQLQ